MKKYGWIAAAALVATSAGAQQAPASVASDVAEPARLAEAREMAAKLLPPGVYRTLMSSSMAPVMANMGDGLKALPLRQLAELGGLSPKDAASLDKVDLERVMAIYDPHWRERAQLTTRAMIDAMGGYFTAIEPELRDAYAHAYAHRFTLPELRACNAFFATPTGAKYASQYMTVASDPAIATEMRAMMPKLMQQMPVFVAAAQKATAALPPPRKLRDLTPSERTKLAQALGVREDQLKDPKGSS